MSFWVSRGNESPHDSSLLDIYCFAVAERCTILCLHYIQNKYKNMAFMYNDCLFGVHEKSELFTWEHENKPVNFVFCNWITHLLCKNS